MTDIIIVAVIILVVGAASLYLYRAKKRGQKCVGCPYCKECGGSCSSEKSSDK